MYYRTGSTRTLELLGRAQRILEPGATAGGVGSQRGACSRLDPARSCVSRLGTMPSRLTASLTPVRACQAKESRKFRAVLAGPSTGARGL